ncbi:hypothetical protein NTE_00114 [Candidatus Nitrososphaera evergladensis SR1]|uniref:Uncharacterized protein n=1 Tax=Candidatus Nitrososphaera evergladensis SR1 TaxID=1459636 RepID=A0A075MLA0_9ARCH|nr:hypothetical protein NTE_00114 [Candidatus Nitrososphaera evergladensis SR1]
MAGALFLFALFFGSLAPAYAQSQSQAARSSGGYYYSGTGFDIEFPPGWNGTLADGKYPVARPSSAAAQAGTSMSVFAVNRLEVKNLIMSGVHVLPELDSSSSGRKEEEQQQCQRTLAELVPVNDINVFHTILECADEQQQHYEITDSYIFFTLTKSIAVGYSAPSKDAYNRYLHDFTSSLKTVKVDEPVNIRSGLEIVLGITKFYKKSIDIQAANDAGVDMVIGASSNNVSVVFDEPGKRFVIKVNGQTAATGQAGRLLVPVDKVLRGPYQVHIDGVPVPDPLVIEDTQTKEKLVMVEYGEGARQIVISGAEVVPEFPLHVAGIMLGAVLSASILYQRKKSSSNNNNVKRSGELSLHTRAPLRSHSA